MILEKVVKSIWFKRALIISGSLSFLALSFGLGVSVGFHKTRFANKWGENYENNFGCGRGDFRDFRRGEYNDKKFNNRQLNDGFIGRMAGGLPGLPIGPGPMMNSHGAFGQVLSISTSSLIVKDQDNIEKTVLFASTTPVTLGFENKKITDLKVDNSVMVIGQPNDAGKIQAKFIRIFNQ